MAYQLKHDRVHGRFNAPPCVLPFNPFTHACSFHEHSQDQKLSSGLMLLTFLTTCLFQFHFYLITLTFFRTVGVDPLSQLRWRVTSRKAENGLWQVKFLRVLSRLWCPSVHGGTACEHYDHGYIGVDRGASSSS